MRYKEEISKDELSAYPVNAFEGEVFLIDSPKEIANAVNELAGAVHVGFDTETRPSFKKGRQNRVALLQLSLANRAFLFRINKTGITDELAEFLADESVKKVGVAIHDDIKGLKEIKPFQAGGFIELQDMVKEYGIKSSGLKKLTAIILGFNISKRQQVSNWENVQLSAGQVKYAATDAWTCHQIYERLINGSKPEREDESES